MAKLAVEDTARYRWMVASRVLAAVVGGYAVTSLATAVLALLLPRVGVGSQASGVLAATLWSFALYTAIVIWVFSTRSAKRAWVGLALSSLVLGAALGALKAWT